MSRNNCVIANYKVLTKEYLPREMPERHQQRQEVGRALEPLLTDEGTPRNLLIHGPPGSGKTAMVDYVIDRLKENMRLQDMYVNCFAQKSRFEVLYELLDKKLTIPRDGTSTEKVKEELDSKIREDPSVIIIDEVDQISNGEILYDLGRYINVPIVMMANDPNVFGYFDQRVQSRMSGVREIRFKGYGHSELVNILQRRADRGLKQGAVSHDKLSKIASTSKSDARKAINTLKLAAQRAESQGKDKITEEMIERASGSAEENQRSESLERLNEHQRICYDIIKDADGGIQIGEVYQKYESEVEEAKSKRTIRRYLRKLEAYDFLEKTGSTSDSSYKV